MKFSMKDFLSKYDHIRSFQRIWSHLLKKRYMENFIFCVVMLERSVEPYVTWLYTLVIYTTQSPKMFSVNLFVMLGIIGKVSFFNFK